jgi:ZIP family zinc transporter
MIYLSFMELIPTAVTTVGFWSSNIAFFLGILFIGIIDFIAPHHFINYCSKNGIKYDKLMLSGFMVAVGIAIHNFPEGIAVFMSSLGNTKFGILIAFATALHNIPEGVAVATPIYFATKSKFKAFSYSLLAGIAEPIGAIVAFIVLQPYLSPILLSYVFAFVAGIMVYISFDELLPSCFENSRGHTAIAGIVIGMLIMALSLNFM